jgi:hypothetical protein
VPGETPRVSYEEFRRLLEAGRLPERPDEMSRFLTRLDPAISEVASEEALEWFRRVWQSRASIDDLYELPTLLFSPAMPSSERFMERLVPENQLSSDAWAFRFPRGFWEWQRAIAAEIPRSQNAAKSTARTKWLDACRQDSKWVGAIAELVPLYLGMVRAKSGPKLAIVNPDEWWTTPRSYPWCGHGPHIEKCTASCTTGSYEAGEAHHGWVLFEDWVSHRPADIRAEPHDLSVEGCECCERQHDLSPKTPSPDCDFCAEALLDETGKKLARRWGGWRWLVDALLFDAEREVRRLAPTEWRERLKTPLPFKRQDRGLLGGNPWKVEPFDYDDRQIASFIVRVPMFTSDLKGDVAKRLGRVFDALWRELRIPNPKGTARSTRRSEDWDRYLSWLWQHRIDGKPIDQIQGVESRTLPDEVLSERAVRDGIALASRTLGEPLPRYYGAE